MPTYTEVLAALTASNRVTVFYNNVGEKHWCKNAGGTWFIGRLLPEYATAPDAVGKSDSAMARFLLHRITSKGIGHRFAIRHETMKMEYRVPKS